ncbi:hypothetical protein QBC37DRAFT_14517 [Rhypophila decipiens]|uniref:Uncharacterized protein n=1 Tax=Rhypophila decipiens TaxID=261697 RepID=A0AAN7B552_9PEZI|nr:hypothetical protein QBC37DRAFT_14517 [Rhypophila decipiens]
MFILPFSSAETQIQASDIELRDTCAAESCIGLAVNSACIIGAVATGNVVTMLGCAAGEVSAFCDCTDCLPDEVQNFMEEQKVCSESASNAPSFRLEGAALLLCTMLVLSVMMGNLLGGW